MAWSACCRNAGVKSIKSSTVIPWRSKAGGFVGNGCVGEVHSPWTSVCFRTFNDWPDRLAGDAVEDVSESLFRQLNDRFHSAAIHIEIEQNRMRRHIVVPNVVMHE